MRAVNFDLMQKLRKISLTKFITWCFSTGCFFKEVNDELCLRRGKLAESLRCQLC